jgi:hypothetical protein
MFGEGYKLLRLSVGIACLLSFLVVPAQTRRNNRASSPAAARPNLVDIRQIDFRNFAYVLNARTYKLRDGFYAENTPQGPRWELGMVDGPFYGDLTGDGKDEVAFVLGYGALQAESAAEARIYTLQQGQARLLATLVVKEAVNCELDHYIRVADGMIIIERVHATKDARCDYNEVTEYRWNGQSFQPLGVSTRTPCRCM